jgi:hypothetical protein
VTVLVHVLVPSEHNSEQILDAERRVAGDDGYHLGLGEMAVVPCPVRDGADDPKLSPEALRSYKREDWQAQSSCSRFFQKSAWPVGGGSASVPQER